MMDTFASNSANSNPVEFFTDVAYGPGSNQSQTATLTLVNKQISPVKTYLTAWLSRTVTADLDPAMGGGLMSAAAYDTAWVAMVRHPRCPDSELAFPHSFEWLLSHQAPDGCWGGPSSYALLPTLAGLLALLRAPEPLGQTRRVKMAIERAQDYLRAELPRWQVSSHESVGFEVLAPALLAELEKYGFGCEFEGCTELMQLYQQKLLIAGPELIYTGDSNLIHSIEAFGPALDFERLKSRQAANGSYGCSPAATAAVLIYGPHWDEQAASWLGWLTERSLRLGAEQAGSMPNAYPIDAFEVGWVLYNLAEAGVELPAETLETWLGWLAECLGEQGGSITRLIGMPTDSDDTGMILAAFYLGLAAYHGDHSYSPELGANWVEQLLSFERENYFACFQRERGVSLSANAHVLAALLSLPAEVWAKFEESALAASATKVANFLYSQRQPEGYWQDKWHLSPYYATACSVLALTKLDGHGLTTSYSLQPTMQWLLAHQSLRDGGWGSGGNFSTVEETAYAVQSLKAILASWQTAAHASENKPVAAWFRAEENLLNRCRQAIRDGQQYLTRQLEGAFDPEQTEPDPARLVNPPLWRGKELYSVDRVVLSAALAALHNVQL